MQSLLRERLRDLLPPVQQHTPNFRIAEQDEFWLISDGDLPVATFHREWLMLDMREFYPDGRAGATLDIRRPYHNVGFMGAILPCNWRINGQMVGSTHYTVSIQETGARLVLHIAETFGEDEAGESEIILYYDDELGCYGVEKRASLALFTPLTVEPANLWARGAGVAWPADATLRSTLWSNDAGGLTWFPHNPLTPNLPGNLDVTGPRRRYPRGGFVAMGTRACSNPAIEILESHTASIGGATCSAVYDEHILQGCPAPLDETGKYRWRFHGRLVSIPEAAMRQLHTMATLLNMTDTPDQYDDWRYIDSLRAAGRQVQPFAISLPFVPGEVNRFAAAIDPRQELIGLYWYFTPQPHGRVTWDQPAHSLLMEGFSATADLAAQPCGPGIRGYQHTGYRLSARIRTELPDGAAWLELSPFLYSPTEVTDPICSPRVGGNTPWQTVSVSIPPSPDKDYLAVQLRLRGQGRAWFDEILLEPWTEGV